jgi:hypothetical protein
VGDKKTRNVARTADSRTTGNTLVVRTTATILLDKPVEGDDTFTMQAVGGAAVTKKHGDGIAVDADHLAVKFDKLKEARAYELVHDRGGGAKAQIFPGPLPLHAMTTAGAKQPGSFAKLYWTLVHDQPKTRDKDLVATLPDYNKISVKEPETA